MTTLVIAHGSRSAGGAMLRVPPGMQVDFYADFDENMLITNGLGVVARGDLGSPNEAYSANDEIPNYGYGALSSEQLGWYLQLDRSGMPAWYVGNELPDPTNLCTDFVGCDNAGANNGTGDHACDGVFGHAHSAGETHVVVLACRGVAGQNNDATTALVGADGQWDNSYQDDLNEIVDDFLARDEAGRRAAWDSWPENSKVSIMPFTAVAAWAEGYGAKQLLASDGPRAMAAYVDQLGQASKDEVNSDPAASAAYFAGRALNYFDADIENFPAWFDTLPADSQTELLQDPGIQAWHQGRGAGAAAAVPAAAAAPAPAPPDGDAVDAENQRYLKDVRDGPGTWRGAGVVILLGDGHSPEAYDWYSVQRDKAGGQFSVNRARIGAGSVTFQDVPPMKQGAVTAAVDRVSEKSVRFGG